VPAKPTALVVLASEPATRSVYADILSQAVTGELVGMLNYSSLVAICPTIEEQLEAVSHAESERRHASAFHALAQELDVPVIENPAATYWKRVRDAFVRHVEAADYLGCLVAQELMLESFAVSLYRAVANASAGKMASVFRSVAIEEERHLAHAVTVLRSALRRDPDGFEARTELLHGEVMGVLAEMVGARDAGGHCGLCRDTCVKESLHLIGLSAPQLRGQAVGFYLECLDRVGVRGERSLRWVANLPT
jgi:fatty aldehyde decarbonylase